jgi:transposase-like protein
MRRSKSSPQTASSIHTPNCPQCGRSMWLAGIEPDSQSDHDKHTFLCRECDHYEALVVLRH